MSHRARLLIVIAVLLVRYSVTAVLVVHGQRSLLINQVDRRLSSVPPFPVDEADSIDSLAGPSYRLSPMTGSYSDSSNRARVAQHFG